MLYQLHWQFKDGSIEFCSQREFSNDLKGIDRHEAMKQFIADTHDSHPLPKDAMWMICNEDSRHFIKTTAEKNHGTDRTDGRSAQTSRD